MENEKMPKCPKCLENENVVRAHAKAYGPIEESDYYFWCRECKVEVDENSDLMIEFEELQKMLGHSAHNFKPGDRVQVSDGYGSDFYTIVGKVPLDSPGESIDPAGIDFLGLNAQLDAADHDNEVILEEPPAGTPPRKGVIVKNVQLFGTDPETGETKLISLNRDPEKPISLNRDPEKPTFNLYIATERMHACYNSFNGLPRDEDLLSLIKQKCTDDIRIRFDVDHDFVTQFIEEWFEKEGIHAEFAGE